VRSRAVTSSVAPPRALLGYKRRLQVIYASFIFNPLHLHVEVELFVMGYNTNLNNIYNGMSIKSFQRAFNLLKVLN
jgi:hypothetical protein